MRDARSEKTEPRWVHWFSTGLCCLVVVYAWKVWGQDATQQSWIFWMLIVAGAVLFPLARPLQGLIPLGLVGVNQWNMTLCLFLCLSPRAGNESAIPAGAWLMWCNFMAWESARKLRRSPVIDPGTLCVAAAGISPAIGAAWLMAHRANWTPWGFDPLIVLLTAAHFHHAGFTLPLMAGLNAKASPGCWTRFSCVAILAGVPLVAAGITCTHFGVLRFVEPFGVTVLVIGALGVAISQIRRGFDKKQAEWVRFCFVISGVSLLSAMILAMGFGLRHLVPNWALTMPQMWMIHGTLNAFGFGLCGLLAWRASSESVRTKIA